MVGVKKSSVKLPDDDDDDDDEELPKRLLALPNRLSLAAESLMLRSLIRANGGSAPIGGRGALGCDCLFSGLKVARNGSGCHMKGAPPVRFVAGVSVSPLPVAVG